jgi:hypothetical protein
MRSTVLSRLIIAALVSAGAVAWLPARAHGQSDPPVLPSLRDVVDAGTLIGEFANNYDQAAEKYSMSEISIRGRVERLYMGKGPGGNPFVRVYLTPREVGSKSMVPIVIGFDPNRAEEVKQLKAGDVVEIGVNYSPMPAAQVIHELDGFIGNKIKLLGPDAKLPMLRLELVTWIKKSNGVPPGPGGADNNLVQDMTKLIDQNILTGNDFTLSFGPGLMLSKKATILAVQDGRMFAIPLTDAQAKAMNVPEWSVVQTTIESHDFRMPAEYQMSPPQIAADKTWVVSTQLLAKVQLKQLIEHFPTDIPAEYGLRMVVVVPGGRVVIFATFHSMAITGTYPVGFGTWNWQRSALKLTKEPTPRLVFFEVVRQVGPEKTLEEQEAPTYQVISQPVPMILNMALP